jgi:hypothetical protein
LAADSPVAASTPSAVVLAMDFPAVMLSVAAASTAAALVAAMVAVIAERDGVLRV